MTSIPKRADKSAPVSAAPVHASGPAPDGVQTIMNVPVVAANNGGPLELDMDLIDEDPKQPRTADNPGFSSQSLAELAASIRLRNVKTPISVRDNPDSPGRYIINHGARRFRGSRRAGKATIPGFIDNDYNEADQVIENLQRNELTAREIADYIGRELAKGIKKGEIARIISKSPAFVTQHVTLLDLPEPIAKAFNSGRVRDVTLVNELVTAFKKTSKEVSGWLGDENQEITRGTVKLLREFLENKLRHERSDDEAGQEEAEEEGEGDGADVSDANQKDERPDNPERLRRAIVQVRHNRRLAHLILNRRPQAEGFAWLKYEDDGEEAEANLAHIRLLALLEA